MMRESVLRWVKRQNEWPDILLLDGGKTHLSTINTALRESNMDDKFIVAALAKREETLYIHGREPIALDRRGEF